MSSSPLYFVTDTKVLVQTTERIPQAPGKQAKSLVQVSRITQKKRKRGQQTDRKEGMLKQGPDSLTDAFYAALAEPRLTRQLEKPRPSR